MADLLTHIAASGMDAAMKEINNKANDLANVNSGAYKSIHNKTQETFYIHVTKAGSGAQDGEKPVGVYQGTGAKTVATYRDLSLGTRKQTSMSLDFYIAGSGYVAVTLPSKETVYYRATSLKINSEGVITTSEGYPLVDNIVLPEAIAMQAIKISENGEMSYDGGDQKIVLGQINLHNFPNEQGLKGLSGGYYLETEASGAPIVGKPGDPGFGTLDQGALELSNVEVANVFADFMAAQRAYELNAKMLRSAEEMSKELKQ